MDNQVHLSWWELRLRDPQWMEKFRGWCGGFQSPFKKIIRKHIAQKGYKSVLDCAAGLCSEYYGFKEDGYEIDYHAVDITPVLVEEGKKNGINIEIQNIDRLSFPDHSFDVCICLDTLNHQKEFEGSIREMVRVAKKEVVISFFRAFSETDENVICVKQVDDNSNPTLINNYFSRKKLNSFLDTMGLRYSHQKTKDGRNLLYIQVGNYES